MENVYSEYHIIGDSIINNETVNHNQPQVIVVNPLIAAKTLSNIGGDVTDGGGGGGGGGEGEDEIERVKGNCHDEEDKLTAVEYIYEDRTTTISASNETTVITSTSGLNDCLSPINYQPISPVESPLGAAVASALDDSYFPISEESIEVENKRPDDYYDDTTSPQSPPSDPFRPECRIPLPDMIDQYPFMDNRTFVRRRNERERTRVRNVNEGFERLRQHLPLPKSCKDKRLSKVETLREAINYIKHLQNLLKSDSNR